ncbi:hypothetical protein PtrSN002B_007612 [Pyrenophora tritici-repentis]|uniref:Uncharacterized protein n=1 Tax=Pyrenophora tritici-repentis TaxID=45151 RepID=A0A2W1DWG2_9PLEO|nr:hypothetical protein PtrV1_11765 [Pyrenophora tritici-repentis]KAF7564779.1 hypothetical protein PtrM4_042130 [Pyrenophora tritici-repentis]KAI0574278.1 hypothetical protein Alg215_08673 [Pyrenophora tritici-repentis]KAI0584994.1 hypothetical protein Alg130_04930 [Pyrenophora tritici-repentis]KAI0610822.1 hypothetical protein TUN205_04910 [Pyrenophora tritici-repentis]
MKQLSGLGPGTLGRWGADAGWVVELSPTLALLYQHLPTLRLRNKGYHVSFDDEYCHVNLAYPIVYTRQTLR